MPKLPLSPTSVWGVVKEMRPSDEDLRPLLVGGAPERAAAVYAALAEGADQEALRDISDRAPSAYDLEGANGLVYASGGSAPSAEDEQTLQLAARKRVGIVCVLFATFNGEPPSLPYVPDTDVITVGPGEELPAERTAERGAQRAGPVGRHLAAHEAWWRMVWDAQNERGDAVSTLTPEFGPPPYAPTLPGSDTPVRDVTEICDWMARRQAERFQESAPRH